MTPPVRLLLVAALACALVPTASASGLAGRWDITFRTPGGQRPAWLEISETPGGTAARMVGFFGAPAPAVLQHGDGELLLGPTGGGVPVMRGRFNGRWIEGTAADGSRWTAVRQPRLPSSAPRWGRTVALFDGRDLSGWRTRSSPMRPTWIVEDGILRGLGGSDLVSHRTFRDFRLHAECRLPRGGDSGIHLRGRHEVQLKHDASLEPSGGGHASIYGFLAARPGGPPDAAGWDAIDITLVGRRVTVVLNGVTVIADEAIPGITGDALDSHEGRPGPIMLQGHLGPVEFRRIDITPAR